MVMLHLFETRRLNKHMSSYQMFKVTMETIAHSDWSVKGVAMATDDENQSAPVCVVAIKHHGHPVRLIVSFMAYSSA